MDVPIEAIDRANRLTEEEIAERASLVSEALLILLEGRPSVVAADACLRAAAELIVTEPDDGVTVEEAVSSAVKVLRAYVEDIQSDLAASHSHRP
ncbi:hypothetical protein LNAOJCKE_0932 [Methylorubrum aminovorans]|uniref:Uncharacterized protein n=1 Tax=Methylorubrum aminovorans TaxID=269069 RepID=A0ABQ4U8J5_9HYPH|nr:hypothetical protein [Methylorubrum aminovorans]GJE63734.1 hypothetical protein LNAOJCKE_0932 [Methylorubrum aminovorans]GMA73663.1 hypothetical protein GCM10025880_00800 [Methylorubrum aminovorans]